MYTFGLLLFLKSVMKTKKTDPNNPLAGKLVFIHISNRKIAQQFESDLQLLGAVSTKSPKFDIFVM